MTTDVDDRDASEMAALASDPALKPVTLAEWICFQREGGFP